MSLRVPKPTTRAGRKLAAFEAKSKLRRVTRIAELEAVIGRITQTRAAADKAGDYEAVAQLDSVLVRALTELHKLERDYPPPRKPVAARKEGLVYEIARENGSLVEDE